MPSTVSSLILMLVALSSVTSQSPQHCIEQLDRCSKATPNMYDSIQGPLDMDAGYKLPYEELPAQFTSNLNKQQINGQDLVAVMSARQKDCGKEFQECIAKHKAQLKREKNSAKATKKQRYITRHR